MDPHVQYVGLQSYLDYFFPVDLAELITTITLSKHTCLLDPIPRHHQTSQRCLPFDQLIYIRLDQSLFSHRQVPQVFKVTVIKSIL